MDLKVALRALRHQDSERTSQTPKRQLAPPRGLLCAGNAGKSHGRARLSAPSNPTTSAAPPSKREVQNSQTPPRGTAIDRPLGRGQPRRWLSARHCPHPFFPMAVQTGFTEVLGAPKAVFQLCFTATAMTPIHNDTLLLFLGLGFNRLGNWQSTQEAGAIPLGAILSRPRGLSRSPRRRARQPPSRYCWPRR